MGEKHKRSNRFREDEEIPQKFRSERADYKGSGCDRGHMAPSATVDFSKMAMQESFLLTNMAPQLPGLNRQGRRYLESYIRDWTSDRGELYVVTGPLFEGETITIGDHVGVPSGFYKVVFDFGQCDGIGFMVPSRDLSKAEIPGFIVSIDQVEERTGLDFLSFLPDEIETDVEDGIGLMW